MLLVTAGPKLVDMAMVLCVEISVYAQLEEGSTSVAKSGRVLVMVPWLQIQPCCRIP